MLYCVSVTYPKTVDLAGKLPDFPGHFWERRINEKTYNIRNIFNTIINIVPGDTFFDRKLPNIELF